MPKEKKKYEQLNFTMRCQISALLKKCQSLQEIANVVKTSRQTVLREIIRNSTYYSKDQKHTMYSCVHFFECHRKNSTNKPTCSYNCENYEKGICCPKLKKYPFVCNSCSKRGHCLILKRFYVPEDASNKYHTRISSAHDGLKTDIKQQEIVKKIASDLLKKKQSPEVIVATHDNITICPLTLRNWVNGHVIENIGPGDLRLFGRRVSKKYDYSKKHDPVKMSELKLGHRYSDYLAFIATYPNSLIVEMDTVMGGKDQGKSVFTIHLVQYHFQFGILLDEHTAENVNNSLKSLFDKLIALDNKNKSNCFTNFINCILADDGSEFDKILDFTSYEGAHIFFTRAYSSSDKAECERNHVLVRYINSKGLTWDDLDQDKINLIFSHINNYPRKSLEYKTPYQLVLEAFGKEFLEIIGIEYVTIDDVNLTQGLIRKVKK